MKMDRLNIPGHLAGENAGFTVEQKGLNGKGDAATLQHWTSTCMQEATDT